MEMVANSPSDRRQVGRHFGDERPMQGHHRVAHLGSARNKPGVGYTYLLTRLDDPAWSHGTTIYYPSPEATSEAGRVALQGYSWLDKSNGTHFDDRHPAASVETPPSDHYRLCRSWRSGGRRRVFHCDPLADAHQPAVLSRRASRARVVEPGQVQVLRPEGKTGRAGFFDASGGAGHPRNLEGSVDVS